MAPIAALSPMASSRTTRTRRNASTTPGSGPGTPSTPKTRRLSAFLGRIARNLALDRYDYNHAAKRSGPFDQLLSELSECIPCQRDDFAQLELTQILNSFLHSLPESRRNLFLRRYWYCESVEELGRRYRMSQSAVKSSLFRTRNKLKAYLEKEGVGIE